MRLTEAQVHQIIHGLQTFMQDGPVEIRLFGSRVDDQQKGGDIDLLLLTEHTDFADSLLPLKHILLASLKKHLGDQKIDLKISAKADVDQDSFLKMILPKSILLYRFD